MEVHLRALTAASAIRCQASGVSRHSTQDEVPTVTPYDKKKMCTLCNVEVRGNVTLYLALTRRVENRL